MTERRARARYNAWRKIMMDDKGVAGHIPEWHELKDETRAMHIACMEAAMRVR